MTRLFTLFPLAAALFAQNGADPFNKPPADVDKALRERITEFYQDHVTGEFRKAEQLVAEDTQDFFYNTNKPRYDSFEIARIDYSDNFTRARASVLCEQNVLMPGFGGKFKVPTPSTWKLENGKWFWYVDQSTLNVTPFGIMKVSPPPADGTKAQAHAAAHHLAYVGRFRARQNQGGQGLARPEGRRIRAVHPGQHRARPHDRCLDQYSRFRSYARSRRSEGRRKSDRDR